MSRRAPLLAALLLASACGGPHYVRVPHMLSDDPGAREEYRALTACYLRILPPSDPDRSLLGRALQKGADALLRKAGLRHQPVDMDFRLLAGAVEERLQKAGAGLVAFRVDERGEDPDPFLDELRPTGVLQVHVLGAAFDRKKEERESVVSVRGKKERRTAVFELRRARVLARAELRLQPEGKLLWRRDALVDHRDERAWHPSTERDDDWYKDWYRNDELEIQTALAREVLARLPEGLRSRQRPVFKHKGHEESEEAFKAAREGRWDRAEPVWKKRLDEGRGDWRDKVNLAVAAEARRDIDEARALYAEAQKTAGGREAKDVRFEEILADLDRTASRALPGRTAESAGWFSAPVAVLPFSDETTSVDGPALLRELARDRLVESGYPAPETAEVDLTLRSHGYSQGGQLRGVPPAKAARFAGTPRVLFGHLEQFNEVMLGLYSKRVIEGSLGLYAADGGKLWESREKVVREEAARKVDAGSLLVGLTTQIARGLAERITRNPLGFEMELFIGRSLRTLPARPPPSARSVRR